MVTDNRKYARSVALHDLWLSNRIDALYWINHTMNPIGERILQSYPPFIPGIFVGDTGTVLSMVPFISTIISAI